MVKIGCNCGGKKSGNASPAPRLGWSVTLPSGSKFSDGTSGTKTYVSVSEANQAIASAGLTGKVSPKPSVQ